MNQPTRFAYRPALDGIRAFAVIAVLLYHAGVAWMPGGFLGVDVFFVLSGYLITALLLVERRETGKIALRAFWLRRARRLLPALFLMLLIVCAYAAFVALPPEVGPLRGDAIGSLFYFSNWRFITEHTSYFQAFGPPSPLRHMWSLAIEEQWYLVWPVIASLVLSVRRGAHALLASVAALLAAASILAMVLLYDANHDPTRAYYGTDTRAHALLIGVLLAIVLARPGRRTRPGNGAWLAREVAGWAGVGVLVWMMTTVGDADSVLYRGVLTGAAVAAAAVVNACVARGVSPLASVLSIAPLRWIGRISYGLYLYHWPIYVWLSEQRTHWHGDALLALRLLVTFAVATASYYLVEMPIRRGGLASLVPRRPARWLVPVAVGVTLAAVLATTGGAQSWRQYLSGGRAQTRVTAPPPEQARDPQGLIFGDSVASSIGPGNPSVPTKTVWQDVALIACGLVPGTPVSGDETFDPPPECASWREHDRQAMDTVDPDLVVIAAGAWEVTDHVVDGRTVPAMSDEGRQLVRKQIEDAVEIATSRGGRAVLLDVPCYGPEAGTFGEGERRDPNRLAMVNLIIEDVADSRPDVSVLHWSRFLCPNGGYEQIRDGVVVRYDGVHFFGDGQVSLWKWLGPRLDDLAVRAVEERSA